MPSSCVRPRCDGDREDGDNAWFQSRANSLKKAAAASVAECHTSAIEWISVAGRVKHVTCAPEAAAREQVSQNAAHPPERSITCIITNATTVCSSSIQRIAHATLQIGKGREMQVAASDGACIQQPSQKETGTRCGANG